MIYNVLIIGAGNIGAFFDDPGSNSILTHAHAFSKHEGFNLVGFVDTNLNKAIEASLIWQTKYFFSIEEAFSQHNIDVVVVAVPDEQHYIILKTLVKFSSKLIFVEKPLTKNILETKEIYDLYGDNKISILVNYTRRFVPEIQKIKEEIASGLYGQYISGSSYYGKGVLHNGSHCIDLLRFLIGNILRFDFISKLNDFYIDDPTVTGRLILENKKFFGLQGIDCNLFSIFEMDMLFESARIRITNSGFNIEKHTKKDNILFKGYKNLVKSEEITTSLDKALYFATENIYTHLEKGKELKCSLEDAYRVMEISSLILQSSYEKNFIICA